METHRKYLVCPMAWCAFHQHHHLLTRSAVSTHFFLTISPVGPYGEMLPGFQRCELYWQECVWKRSSDLLWARHHLNCLLHEKAKELWFSIQSPTSWACLDIWLPKDVEEPNPGVKWSVISSHKSITLHWPHESPGSCHRIFHSIWPHHNLI